MDLVLNANGKPFTDSAAAEQKAGILTSELGEPYVVVDHPLGGYAVIRKNSDSTRRSRNARNPMLPPMEAVNPRREDAPTMVAPVAAEPAAPADGDIVLRPSWRTFWKHNITVISGAILVATPFSLLQFVFVDLLNTDPDAFENHLNRGLLHLISVIGFFMILSAISHMLVLRQSCRYLIGRHGIETRLGIISLQTQRVEFRFIRSINVRQSPIERLLNIGLVEFSSAAREGGDVVFRNIYDPRGVEMEVGRRMDMATYPSTTDE